MKREFSQDETPEKTLAVSSHCEPYPKAMPLWSPTKVVIGIVKECRTKKHNQRLNHNYGAIINGVLLQNFFKRTRPCTRLVNDITISRIVRIPNVSLWILNLKPKNHFVVTPDQISLQLDPYKRNGKLKPKSSFLNQTTFGKVRFSQPNLSYQTRLEKIHRSFSAKPRKNCITWKCQRFSFPSSWSASFWSSYRLEVSSFSRINSPFVLISCSFPFPVSFRWAKQFQSQYGSRWTPR